MKDIVEHTRVLVTGGAGFIGSNLVEALLAQDNQVVCLDNFSTGLRENVEPFLSNKSFTLIEGDIRDRDVCAKAVEGCELVFHQAALGSVPRSINDPLTSTEVNVIGFANMLFAAGQAKVRRMVYASSSSVYGDISDTCKQEGRIGRCISPYAMTKRVDELFADNFAMVYGYEAVGLRYFNVFGPRQTTRSVYAAVIPRFAEALVARRSPTINGDGSVSRDFTFVANVVKANQLAALNGPANTVYNVGCGGQISVKELFYAIRGILAKYDSAIGDIEPIYGPPRAGDVHKTLADISRARGMLGYVPQVDVPTGLQKAMDWYWNTLSK